MSKIALCRIDGCNKPGKNGKRNLCPMHVSRYWRTGSYELVPLEPVEKLCHKCNATYLDSTKTRKRKYCNTCRSNTHLLYGTSKWNSTEAGKSYMKAYLLEHKKKWKKIVFDHYGSVCNCCGENNEYFLSIDHTNNDGHVDRKKHITGTRLYQHIANGGFGDNYQVLCMNCNFGKKITRGLCPHKIAE